MNKLNASKNGMLKMKEFDDKLVEKFALRNLTTFASNKKMPIHNWFPYLQGFSALLVEKIIKQHNICSESIVLDPFCGVGTTPLTCKQNGINSIGIDISPLAIFVSRVKMNEGYNPNELLNITKQLVRKNVKSMEPPKHPIFKKGIIKENVDKILTLKDSIIQLEDELTRDFLLLALMSIIEEVSLIQKDGAHYRYLEKSKSDDPFQSFQSKVNSMVSDIKQETLRKNRSVNWKVDVGDARNLDIDDQSVDFVITSPPYLNRDNYIAQNKLELFLMDFISDMKEYRELTWKTLRSHVEAKYRPEKKFRMDEVDLLVNEIKHRPLSNPKIPEMIHGYFEDMNIVFFELARCITDGGKIAIVVGNSSWSGVLIEVDKILSKIATNHGFNIDEIAVTRYKLNSAQQIKKYGRIPIRESIIVATAIR